MKEQRERFCGGIHEVQKDYTDMEDKDGVQTGREIHPLFTIDILNQQSLGAIERAVIKVEMEGSVAGSGPSDKQCRGTASSLLPWHMQEPDCLLQFQQSEESAYQRTVCASRVISNQHLLPGQLSLPRPLKHGVGN